MSCMPTSMLPVILRRSTMPVALDVLLVGCVSTSQSCPTRRFDVRVEAQAAGLSPVR